jgi:predicted membrane chloride channel (bestrophin family)
MTVLVSGAVGFAMLGLDEITFILENPFALMPLYQQSKNIMLDVADAFTCQPPNLKSNLQKIKAEPLNDEENIKYPYGTTWEEKPVYW